MSHQLTLLHFLPSIIIRGGANFLDILVIQTKLYSRKWCKEVAKCKGHKLSLHIYFYFDLMMNTSYRLRATAVMSNLLCRRNNIKTSTLRGPYFNTNNISHIFQATTIITINATSNIIILFGPAVLEWRRQNVNEKPSNVFLPSRSQHLDVGMWEVATRT